MGLIKRGYLKEEETLKLDAYFRATNFLSVGQLYLLDNPLLKRPLELSDIKPKLIGHWGTAPGQNFIYLHLNRVINKYNLNMIYISGPGHGGQAMVANSYLEGTYSEIYPYITKNEEGIKRLFKQFSFPGGISSHVAPEVPGSINEGGELGYSLAHAFGAVLDNPSLIAACVVGDGEAETGPLATSWHASKFINPINDGVVLPILHLNGYKISNPTVFARMSKDELANLFKGYGWEPYYLEGDDPLVMHDEMAKIMDEVITKIKRIKEKAIKLKNATRIKWPMIILVTPKGWTCPKVVEQRRIEGTFRAHQVPLAVDKDHQANLKVLDKWLKSYHPEELFDENGELLSALENLVPKGNARMSANPHANGGLLLKEIKTPNFKDYGVDVFDHGIVKKQDMIELGKYVRDLIKLNKSNKNFRVFGPDEALSNRLGAMFEVSNRTWNSKKLSGDEYLDVDGRIMDAYLSEHLCEGMLEGYLLTGRYGFFHSYEAFIRIVDSMANQHAKWLKISRELLWRKDIASLNYVLTSHVWQQDHNGYTHQNPGFIDNIITKKSEIVRVYFPPDANCLLSCFDHCIKTKNYINVIVASKHPSYQWLNIDDASVHCEKGIGIWEWASTNNGKDPDIVLACCGDTPTIEVLAAAKILKTQLENLNLRVVNVVDLMRLQSKEEHPHGLTQEEYNSIFTTDKPIIFSFHGYPNLIHQLTYKRENRNLHVSGYKEEGTITTAFDMRVQNEIDRYHLVLKVLKYIDFSSEKSNLENWCNEKLIEHREYIVKYGQDLEEIRNWTW